MSKLLRHEMGKATRFSGLAGRVSWEEVVAGGLESTEHSEPIQQGREMSARPADGAQDSGRDPEP